MRVTRDNKVYTIPDSEVKRNMELLEISEQEAIEMWFDDHDITTNEEQEELDSKAKMVKITHGAGSEKPRKKSEKPRTVAVSDAKKALFSEISTFLDEFASKNGAEVTILKDNKLFQVKIDDTIFKIDLIQTRNKKN